jgi:tRNA threonylcarbamoyladenosine biosynthesis protein TsaE
LSKRILPEVSDTERLGAALAGSLRRSAPGPLIVYLQGELGSGKTTLARGLLRALGVADTIRSPTYTLIESYNSADWRVLHTDLYRLNDAAELAPLGLRDELTAGVLLLIEWPDRATGTLPTPDLRVMLSITDAGRIAQLQAATDAGRAWLDAALRQLNSESKRV